MSPLLANLYLSGLDKAVNGGKKMKAIMVRFADDLVILCRKGQGPQMYEALKRWLEKHKLYLESGEIVFIKCLSLKSERLRLPFARNIPLLVQMSS